MSEKRHESMHESKGLKFRTKAGENAPPNGV